MPPHSTHESVGARCWQNRNYVYVHCYNLMTSIAEMLFIAIRAALQRLGYNKAYHMMSASVENPPDCLMWHDALCAKYDGVGKFGRAEWDQLLGDCQVRQQQQRSRILQELYLQTLKLRLSVTGRLVPLQKS